MKPLRSSRPIRAVFIAAMVTALAVLISSCNDTGVSPYPPEVKYKTLAVTAYIYSSLADTIVSTGGAVDGYTVSPALPPGLTLNAQTGLISGRGTRVDSLGKTYTITAMGPSGSATATVNIKLLDDPRAPDISYYPGGNGDGPGFIWGAAATALSPDTPTTFGGIVATYKVTPALPAGVVLDSVTGIFSGKPTATQAAKEYTVVGKGPHGTDSALVYIGVYPTTYPFALLKRGLSRFQNNCVDCHNNDGHGGRCPPLYHSDYLMADRKRPIRIQLVGLPNGLVDSSEFIVVKGDTFTGAMPAIGGSDSAIAGVLTFIRAYFNGATDFMSVQEVSDERNRMILLDTGHAYTIDPHQDQ